MNENKYKIAPHSTVSINQVSESPKVLELTWKDVIYTF